MDADGYLTAKYVKFAEFPTLYHQGAGAEHQVAITFDDGPDPRWTPQVLDILKAANVKAAFFVVGVNAERYPGLVRRIVNEGHEIGNHTYYHPNLALCWPEHIRLELNATQLLLETITGRATTLFRPPYAADSSPTQLTDLTPLKIAEDLNYLVVLESIDPQDWAKPGADIILQRVKQQRRDGSIILLHDAGGDRSQTVEALPRILDWLHTRGDTVVPLSTLLGTTRDALMPVVQNNGAIVRASGEQHRISRLPQHRRISLGVHDRGDGACGCSHADCHLAGLSVSTRAAKRFCGTDQCGDCCLQRRQSDCGNFAHASCDRLQRRD